METRLGVFFDGTGNNMWNDLAIGDGSQSNVAKLYKLYKDQNYHVFYGEGVGTEAYTQNNHLDDGSSDGVDEITPILKGEVAKNSHYALDSLIIGAGAVRRGVKMGSMKSCC